MSAVVRGRPTAPSVVPRHWRGPLPDLSIQRRLPATTDTAAGLDGYAEVPVSLLHGGFQDLAVLIWTQLRLWFDDSEGKTSYCELAEALGVDSAKPSAVKAKFSAALQPLLGTWIERRRVTENQFAYRAVMYRQRERYAMVRRWDLALLSKTKGTRKPVKPADIADFGRWQLECGARGWTAESTTAIAARWGVTPPTIRSSRRRLEELGLLKVVSRDNRLSELTWLQELYDPHWMVPSQTTIEPKSGLDGRKKSLTLGPAGSRKKPDLGGEESLTLVGKKTSPPIEELSESLADDLSALGGTSVPPLTSVTRGHGAAPPAASRGKRSAAITSAGRIAGQILGSHRLLATAPKHYRAAMYRRLRDALEQGLEPEHAAQAVKRVVEEGDIDLECEVLRRALQQAWADHHAGMCVACGEVLGQHAASCASLPSSGTGSAADTSPDPGTPAIQRRPIRESSIRDPLQMLADLPVEDPAQITDDAEAVAWIRHELTVQIMAVDDQREALRTLWNSWRRRLPDHAHLVDQAAEHVRYALDQRRAS